MRRLLLVSALGLLAACSTNNTKATVAALESGLTAADDVALGYLTLPVCNGTNGPVCGNATIRAQIKLAAADAYSTVKAAEGVAAAGGTPDTAAATAAIAALQSLLTANVVTGG